MRDLTGLEIVSQKAKIVDGEMTEFRVIVDVTFILGLVLATAYYIMAEQSMQEGGYRR
ncbi:MAG: hypothetical protein HON76_00620 [Candidatus Scalindua sp.]|nr:hypothetical protein [Candidatus Scalindua sp.]MBT5304296.1 hypothetical protein [Candidatus Scalindua sp.]MBT6052033.1 hypothetical protein [Candidatus Scalindua sp.]MBT6228999.1 hypothetical protein [Candidatus Scalindua sp.]MBT6561015.1 hypothetical protein [Candidatus Scalindua sp.]